MRIFCENIPVLFPHSALIGIYCVSLLGFGISHIFFVKVNSSPVVTFVVVSFCQQRQVCTVQTVQKVGDSTVPLAFRQWWSRRAENCGVPQLQFSDKLVTCLFCCERQVLGVDRGFQCHRSWKKSGS